MSLPLSAPKTHISFILVTGNFPEASAHICPCARLARLLRFTHSFCFLAAPGLTSILFHVSPGDEQCCRILFFSFCICNRNRKRVQKETVAHGQPEHQNMQQIMVQCWTLVLQEGNVTCKKSFSISKNHHGTSAVCFSLVSGGRSPHAVSRLHGPWHMKQHPQAPLTHASWLFYHNTDTDLFLDLEEWVWKSEGLRCWTRDMTDVRMNPSLGTGSENTISNVFLNPPAAFLCQISTLNLGEYFSKRTAIPHSYRVPLHLEIDKGIDKGFVGLTRSHHHRWSSVLHLI